MAGIADWSNVLGYLPFYKSWENTQNMQGSTFYTALGGRENHSNFTPAKKKRKKGSKKR